jgi:hypothetical protein
VRELSSARKFVLMIPQAAALRVVVSCVRRESRVGVLHEAEAEEDAEADALLQIHVQPVDDGGGDAGQDHVGQDILACFRVSNAMAARRVGDELEVKMAKLVWTDGSQQ